MARCFKVSTLVILRRIHDAGHLTQDELWAAYRAELERLRAIPKGQRRELLSDPSGPRQQTVCKSIGRQHA